MERMMSPSRQPRSDPSATTLNTILKRCRITVSSEGVGWLFAVARTTKESVPIAHPILLDNVHFSLGQWEDDSV